MVSMVQFKVIDNRRKGASILAELSDDMDYLRDQYISTMIQHVADASPVDTGTYMDSHHIYSGKSGAGATESSHGKPRNQDRDSHAAVAVGRMYGEYQALGDGIEQMVIANTAVHARIVEYQKGYAVYESARAVMGAALRRLAAELGR